MGLAENLAALSQQTSAADKANKQTLDAIISIAQERALSTSSEVGVRAPVTTAVARRLTGTNGNAPSKVSGLNSDFQSKLDHLLQAVGGKAHINSGYRSPERQAQLFAAAVKKYGSEAAARKYVAPPGHSNHNKGIAADLGYADASTKAKIHELAGKYGLYFPMSWEDWHIEPIGSRQG